MFHVVDAIEHEMLNSNSEEARATAMQCIRRSTTWHSQYIRTIWNLLRVDGNRAAVAAACRRRGKIANTYTENKHTAIAFGPISVIYFGGFDAAIVCNFLIIFE